MFDAEKLKVSFKGALPKGAEMHVEPSTVDEQPNGSSQAAALVTLTNGSKVAKRVFTEADQASSKLAATIKAFCERVA
jgi:copper(I)-binding protein